MLLPDLPKAVGGLAGGGDLNLWETVDLPQASHCMPAGVGWGWEMCGVADLPESHDLGIEVKAMYRPSHLPHQGGSAPPNLAHPCLWVRVLGWLPPWMGLPRVEYKLCDHVQAKFLTCCTYPQVSPNLPKLHAHLHAPA